MTDYDVLKKRVKDLVHDNRHLYFVLGCLTDAIEQLPELHQKAVLNTLNAKTKTAPDECVDTLYTLIESLEKK